MFGNPHYICFDLQKNDPWVRIPPLPPIQFQSIMTRYLCDSGVRTQVHFRIGYGIPRARRAGQRFPADVGELSTSNARTVAAPRVSTPNLLNISCTCFFTVDSVMPRMVAMSEFVLPWASQSNASAARGVRPSASKGREEEKSGLKSRLACCSERRRRASIARTRSALATGLVRYLASRVTVQSEIYRIASEPWSWCPAP